MSNLESCVKKVGLYVDHMGQVSKIKKLGTTPPASELTTEQKAKVDECIKGMLEAGEFAVSTLGSLIKHITLVDLVVAPTVGFGLGKVVNTNKNPSKLKTSLTVIGSSLVSAPISVAGGTALTVNNTISDAKKLQELETTCKEVEALVEAELDRLSKLTAKERETALTELGLNSEQVKAYENAIQKAVDEAINAISLYLGIGLTVSAVSAYHGYKRSGGLGALGFFLAGKTGLGVALAQGFAKPVHSVETITKK